jgi:hypothetical protein
VGAAGAAGHPVIEALAAVRRDDTLVAIRTA